MIMKQNGIIKEKVNMLPIMNYTRVTIYNMVKYTNSMILKI